MKGSIKEKMLLVLGGVFLVILLGLLSYDLLRRGIFNGKVGVNVVVVGDNGVSLLLLRPEIGMAGWIKIPNGAMISIFDTDASYPIESLWKYGVLESNPYEVMKKSVGGSMGVVISGVVKVQDSDVIDNLLGKLISVGVKTDLSVRDRVVIQRYLTDSIKAKRVLELSLPSSVFDEVNDLDGVKTLRFNQTINLWTKNKFVIESVLGENADVSINNISGIGGKGSLLANQLESTGMHVTELKADSDEWVEGDGCVYYSDNVYEVTEQILKEQVGCTKIQKPKFMEDDRGIRLWIK